MADGVEVVGGARDAGAMGVIVAGGLAFEVGEDVVAQIELDLTRGADDDLTRDVEEEGGERGNQEQAQRVASDGVE